VIPTQLDPEGPRERLVGVSKDRTTPSFEVFFPLGGELAAGALNIPDGFHMLAKLNKALNEVRAGEARRMVREGYEPLLKNKRWGLLKRPENLTNKQNISLRELLAYNLKSVRAYPLKEEFQPFWDYESPARAAKYLDAWRIRAMRSRIEPVKTFARTVRTHQGLLLNYFKAKKQFSSGITEGLNNEAKLTLRKAYGHRTFRLAGLSLYHVLGKLSEPKIAHRFF